MTDPTPLFLSKKDILAAFGLRSLHTIDTMLKDGLLPPPIMVGKLLRWPASVLTDLAAGRRPGAAA
jgi:predicted DNA-binding transcriptional regulator AlpA